MDSSLPDISYFTCTLGEAADNSASQHPWETVNEFIDHQARGYPDRPAVGFPIPPGKSDQRSAWESEIYTFENLRQKSSSYALAFEQLFLEKRRSRTVGLLCSSSSEFLLGWLGLMRRGHSVLLLAPQSQPSAIAHLCRECQVSLLVCDSVHLDLAHEAIKTLEQVSAVDLICLPEIQGLDISKCATEKWSIRDTDIAYLHHTSGTSTGLPKPIPQTHRAAVGVLPCFSNGKENATFTTTPFYHGGVADCFRSWTSGGMIWLFPGRDVPITASNIIKSLDCARVATRSCTEHVSAVPIVRYFSSVPYVLQMLAAEPEGLKLLKEMALVGVGGAALPPSVGDELVGRGVNLVSRFGSAECGFLMSSHRDYKVDKEWQYLRSYNSSHLSFEPQEDGLVELIVLSTWPHMAKRNRDDGSYATADLFEPHPKIADAWRYHSRGDSQLTLMTGKKFDPAPLEAAIATSPSLTDCLIFGNGRQHPGALLFRSDSSADKQSEETLDAVWPIVEKLNSESQAHTRLSRSMLVIMPKKAPGLKKSSKGTTMRGAAEKTYATEISKAYEEPNTFSSINTDGSDSTPIPDAQLAFTILDIIRGVVGTENAIPEDTDLFSLGVDSVACMQIRALLQSRLLPANAPKLPLNIVYDCGNIRSLAKHLVTIRRGGGLEKEDEVGQMRDLVAEYGAFGNTVVGAISRSVEESSAQWSDGQIVVLTGATGALGAHILDQLRAFPPVSKIHCLVRAASLKAARERVSKSLIARNKSPLDEKTSSSKIQCHPCRLSDAHLGLESTPENANIYTTLASQTTAIIHAAWAVNFSMRLSSFVKDHIAGLRNLLNFALASPHTPPPRFIFCSSTASVLGPNTASPIPESISHDPLPASPLGYSRSKWVAEAICVQAHLDTRLRDRISILRIGQLCGDTKNGIWNVTEAWPLMLSSVKVTATLPDLKDPLDWLPVDVAARAVLEIAISHNPSINPTSKAETKQNTSITEVNDIPVYHILNPNAQTTWSDLLHWLRKLSPDLKIVPPAEWVTQLDNLKGGAANHPATKLLGLWKDAYTSDEKDDAKDPIVFEMQKTKQAVNAMKNVEPIDEQQFGRIWGWIEREMMEQHGKGKDT